MVKRKIYLDCVDPDYQRWGRTYSKFPGVAECIRLLRSGKVQGAWIDIILAELAENCREHLQEMIDAFNAATSSEEPSERVACVILMAFEIAKLPESVPFLSDVLRKGDVPFTPFAQRALEEIDTRESRTALYQALNSPGNAPHP